MLQAQHQPTQARANGAGTLRPAQREGAGKGIRKKRRHMRAVLKEGVEAALRADPEVLENCKPKTAYGGIVRGLVLEAAKCKATPLKILMSLIDWELPDDEDDVEEDDGTPWDWSREGVWETMPEPESASGPEDAVSPAGDAARAELKRRLTRLVEAGQHEHALRIMDAIRGGQYDEREPVSTG